MTLPDLLREVARLGMTITLAQVGKLRWQTREQPSSQVLRSLADHKGELLILLDRPTLPTLPTEPHAPTLADRLAAALASDELALAVEEADRIDFPNGMPPVLVRCITHNLLGPLDPPAEGMVAWWGAARRQVLRMIDGVKRQPERYASLGAAKCP